MNLVELLTGEDEQKQSPCEYGNIVEFHACYCHSPKSPFRKCPQWRTQDPYEDCKYYKKFIKKI